MMKIAGETVIAGSIDEYIAAYPMPIRKLLQKIRVTIKKAAPAAVEAIRYGIPTFILHGNLVHFGGYKNHIGFYPAPSGIDAFKKELSVFEGSKGTIRFPNDKPLPLSLITKIVKYRVQVNTDKSKNKNTYTSITKKSIPKKLSDADKVNEWMNKQDATVKDEIEAVRKIIKSVKPGLNERIKWNAPSYHYLGQDMLTFGPYKNKNILLVFHHPQVVKIQSTLLLGEYTNRRLVSFKNKAEAIKQKNEFTRIISELLVLVKNNNL